MYEHSRIALEIISLTCSSSGVFGFISQGKHSYHHCTDGETKERDVTCLQLHRAESRPDSRSFREPQVYRRGKSFKPTSVVLKVGKSSASHAEKSALPLEGSGPSPADACPVPFAHHCSIRALVCTNLHAQGSQLGVANGTTVGLQGTRG